MEISPDVVGLWANVALIATGAGCVIGNGRERVGKEIRQKDGGWTTYLGAAIAIVVCSSSLYNVNGILKIVLRLGC